MGTKIAIIGAGIAGLTVAHALREHADIAVFEKSRGLGGRMATRRADKFAFDHGTQYFTGRSRPFREFIAPFREKGIITPWDGKVITLARGKDETDRIWFEPHYVAAPTMNAWCKALGEGIPVHTETEIAYVERVKKGWELTDLKGIKHSADWIIVTAPAPQTVNLLSDHLPTDHPLRTTHLQGCYALMLGFHRPWNREWIGAKFDDSPLGWASVDSSKPGRDASLTSLVLHSTNAWANANIDKNASDVEKILLDEFTALTGIDSHKADHRALHRWKYALVENPSKTGFYCDAAQHLAAVGDWSVTSRVEEVWFAATELADAIRKKLWA